MGMSFVFEAMGRVGEAVTDGRVLHVQGDRQKREEANMYIQACLMCLVDGLGWSRPLVGERTPPPPRVSSKGGGMVFY